MLGRSAPTPGNWERAGGTVPNEADLVDAARVYGTTVQQLRYGDVAKSPTSSDLPRTDRGERLWVARFRAELTELDASDAEIEAAVDLVRSDPALAFMRADEPNATALDAMRWFGSVLRREVVRRHTVDQAPRTAEELARILDEAWLRGASHAEILDIFATYPVDDLPLVRDLSDAITKGHRGQAQRRRKKP